jgi:hypothetical protein
LPTLIAHPRNQARGIFCQGFLRRHPAGIQLREIGLGDRARRRSDNSQRGHRGSIARDHSDLACESAPHDVPANLGEINEAPRRSAPKPHAGLHRRAGHKSQRVTVKMKAASRFRAAEFVWEAREKGG